METSSVRYRQIHSAKYRMILLIAVMDIERQSISVRQYRKTSICDAYQTTIDFDTIQTNSMVAMNIEQ